MHPEVLQDGSVRFGAIVTNIETSLPAPPSAWRIPIARRLGCIDGIAHSGALGASPDRTHHPGTYGAGNGPVVNCQIACNSLASAAATARVSARSALTSANGFVRSDAAIGPGGS